MNTFKTFILIVAAGLLTTTTHIYAQANTNVLISNLYSATPETNRDLHVRVTTGSKTQAVLTPQNTVIPSQSQQQFSLQVQKSQPEGKSVVNLHFYFLPNSPYFPLNPPHGCSVSMDVEKDKAGNLQFSNLASFNGYAKCTIVPATGEDKLSIAIWPNTNAAKMK